MVNVTATMEIWNGTGYQTLTDIDVVSEDFEIERNNEGSGQIVTAGCCDTDLIRVIAGNPGLVRVVFTDDNTVVWVGWVSGDVALTPEDGTVTWDLVDGWGLLGAPLTPGVVTGEPAELVAAVLTGSLAGNEFAGYRIEVFPCGGEITREIDADTDIRSFIESAGVGVTLAGTTFFVGCPPWVGDCIDADEFASEPEITINAAPNVTDVRVTSGGLTSVASQPGLPRVWLRSSVEGITTQGELDGYAAGLLATESRVSFGDAFELDGCISRSLVEFLPGFERCFSFRVCDETWTQTLTIRSLRYRGGPETSSLQIGV